MEMKKKFALLMIIAILLLAACSPSAEELNNRGNKAFAGQDYKGALSAYQEAQDKSPETAESYYNAANTHYRRKDYQQAQQQLQQGLTKAQGDLSQNSFYNLGNTLFNAQQFEPAIEAYKEALRLNPDDEQAKHNLELALKRVQQNQDNKQEQQQDDEQQNQDDKQDKPQDSQQDKQ